MSGAETLWAWYRGQAGRPWEMPAWSCFELLVSGQRAAGLMPRFSAAYGERRSPDGKPESDAAWASRLLLRQIARGLAAYRRLERPVAGAACLFRDPDGRPVHVGLYMPDGRMAHVNTTTATTLASIGPGTDYHAALEGFYVPA